MSTNTSPAVDGRRARRERSRAAVIDAVFSLIADGKVPPSVESVAERSEVSVSSIFRMFDGVDDMRIQACEQFGDRYAHLLDLSVDDGAEQTVRLAELIRARLDLYRAAGPLMQMARHRALDHDVFADRVAAQRASLAAQVQRCLRAETALLTPAAAANLVALVDAATSPEVFDLLGAAHARTPRQIEQTWRRSLRVLVAEWCETNDTETQGEA